jgi:hypothetical protein
MAGLQKRSGSYRVIFRYRGKQHSLPLGKVSGKEARAKSAQVDYLLMRLAQRLVELPAGLDIVDFLLLDGKPPARAVNGDTPCSDKVALGDLRDRYLATHSESL